MKTSMLTWVTLIGKHQSLTIDNRSQVSDSIIITGNSDQLCNEIFSRPFPNIEDFEFKFKFSLFNLKKKKE